MSMHVNGTWPNQAHMKNIYTEQIPNRPDPPPAGREDPVQQQSERDIVNISHEARKLQSRDQAMQANQSSINQERDIYRPGQEQTELRAENSLKAPRETGNNTKTDQVFIDDREDDLESADKQNRIEKEQLLRAGQERNTAQEPLANPENESNRLEDSNQRVQNPATAADSMSKIDSASTVQAYATAANMTQANLIVNYKL